MLLSSLPLEDDSTLGWLYYDRQLLIPLKVDITYSGCRLVDSFCWNVFSTITAYEFAVKTCNDLNLPEGFKWKFTIQIQEQIDAFVCILSALRYRTPELDAKVKKVFSQPQQISIGIRYNTLDYSESIKWNVNSRRITPETFARITCTDLCLPPQIQPLISFKIREALIRTLVNCFDEMDTLAAHAQYISSTTTVSPVPISSAVELITSLWKHAKPTSIADQMGMQRSKLPKNRETNGIIWIDEKTEIK